MSARSTISATNAGAAHGSLGSGPVRTCIGCRARERSSDLLRVVAVGGDVVPDPRHRLPGRGAWLHPSTGCLDTAERRRAFVRALRAPGQLDTTGVRDFLNTQGIAGSTDRTAAGSRSPSRLNQKAGRPNVSTTP
jgi:predicted RNA-binding protein YlxR (DUF448 family)